MWEKSAKRKDIIIRFDLRDEYNDQKKNEMINDLKRITGIYFKFQTTVLLGRKLRRPREH